MKKITEINIINYRAFYNEKETPENKSTEKYKIELKNGENLLVYGENGSGKSSLFKALEDFFNSASDSSLTINENIHTKPDLPEAEIKLAISEKSSSADNLTKLEEIVFNKAAPTTYGNILLKNASQAFLSYRDILRTYFIDIEERTNNPNLFDLFFNNLLSKLIDETANQQIKDELSRITKTVNEFDKTVSDTLKEMDAEEPAKTIEETKGRAQVEEDILGQITNDIADFNEGLTKLLDTSIKDINKYSIDYFKTELKLSIQNKDAYISIFREDNKYKIKTEFFLDCEYFGIPVKAYQSYQSFLNEARLSAIAISIYLAAIKQDHPNSDNFKILFLDDIFIGLDLSNRIPLLDILKEKFSDWQIFLTTYDRHWFEVAKQHLGKDWKVMEMYTVASEEKSFEKPLLILSENHFTKAEKYFKAGDYPASLNYLRKELEAKIKERLPEEVTRHYEGKPIQLIHLWEMMVERYNNNKQGHLITSEIKSEIKVVRLSLLNPHSHDNLSTPVYKSELQRAIKLVNEIANIPIIKCVTLLSSGMELLFKHPKVSYSLTIRLEEDWQIDISSGIKNHKYPKCRLIEWEYNGIMNWNMIKNAPMSATDIEKHNSIAKENLVNLNKLIKNHLGSKLLVPLTESEFYSNTSFESIWTIEELLKRCDNQKRDNWFCRIFRK